jgi:eukaryotic-like serine/threonine-protein kinase
LEIDHNRTGTIAATFSPRLRRPCDEFSWTRRAASERSATAADESACRFRIWGASRNRLTILEKGTAEERIAYLKAACGDDSNLRQRVERLLAGHPQVGNFLEPPTPALIGAPGGPTVAPVEHCLEWSSTGAAVSHHGPSESVGSVIAGRYKLLETLGQGGMGAVFMAQQTEPVKRLVALKLIKLGMDSRQILARFAAERQALALMDHPNIAKVLDAGATDSGRPFFVMELFKGVPITHFCDERQLSPRERLELFIPVCHAIQHAHQKGSSTGTSSPRTCWSPCTTTAPCPR